MLSVAKYITNGLQLELKPQLKKYIDTGLDTVCAITGERITKGILWYRVIPPSTAEYLDLMSGMAFPYLGLPAATAFKGSWNMGSRLIFEDGTAHHPYISIKSAEKSERSYWSTVVRDVWAKRKGENCLCVITDNFQKKIWPKARIGQLGTNTQVLLFDSGRLRLQNLIVDWGKMIDVLGLMEMVYAAGFNKQAISESLFISYAAMQDHGQLTLDWESTLAGLRKTPEFAVSLLIAQKPLKEKNR